MDTGNYSVSINQADHPYKFFIRDGSLTRATVTILAKNPRVARNMANALFPGADLSESEVPHADRH
jgi:hypothetical protein